jgi:ABC-type bacteriocin/lantibiotic exporter with double-glycine peptidase domain
MNSSFKLDVPYYQQTHFATCGPAALMMVIKYWDRSIKLSYEMEFYIWKNTKSFIFKGATFQFGLANTAKKLGFTTLIYQKAKISSYKKPWKSIFDVFEFFISFNTRISKIPIYYGKNSMDIIIEALEKKIPPLVLINLEPISGENIFHWIVVTGINKDNVIFNDPDISEKPRKDVQVKKEIFEKSIATDDFSNITFPFSMFRFPPAIVLVYK